jgi:8-oxo-dGTP diphosphatase
VTQTPHASDPIARATAAAGALFVDEHERIMLVRPTYKPYWDIPGGYVKPGESPYQACCREVAEELGITPDIGRLLVADWAPDDAGDKYLFVFDGGRLDEDQLNLIRFDDSELDEFRFVAPDEVPNATIDRLSRRLISAFTARHSGGTQYLEHGLASL